MACVLSSILVDKQDYFRTGSDVENDYMKNKRIKSNDHSPSVSLMMDLMIIVLWMKRETVLPMNTETRGRMVVELLETMDLDGQFKLGHLLLSDGDVDPVK